MGRKIKVLVIDDSAVMRKLLTELLNDAGDIEVVDTALDPIFAMSKIRNLRPDVLTLDIEMPRMDGLSFLETLMKNDPMPVVMVSALTQRGCETTLKALELGAVDYVTKPSIDVSSGVILQAAEIAAKVRVAARAKVKGPRALPIAPLVRNASALDTRVMQTTDRIIAIGASTGGTQAVTEVITSLPAAMPGIAIVQHMPPVYTTSFAKRLDSISRLDVREAQGGERILAGTVFLAPGGRHLSIRRDGAMYYTVVSDGPPVNFVKPAVDLLFRSVAEHAGRNAVGVILTGMGEDGARGLKEMRDAGASTIAQDESTSIVFGMPKKAIDLGAAEKVLPLENIAQHILALSRVNAEVSRSR